MDTATRKTLPIIVMTILLLYALSFGPVFFLTVKVCAGAHGTMRKAMAVVFVTAYAPHIFLMAASDAYYAYGSRWVEWASGHPPYGSRSEFNERLHDRGLYGI
jgi:hypothetical protein